MQLANQKKVIVVGCGRLGAGIAEMLSNDGYQVIVIDADRESFVRLPEDYSGFEITGDGSDVDILKSAGIEEAETLIAVTGDDNVNSLVGQIAKKLFSTESVCIRLYDESKTELVEGLGISTVCTQLLALSEVNRLLKAKE